MDFQRDSVNPVFQDLLDQLKRSAESLPDTQKRMMSLTGVAWSDDRTIKVVVGPRGQLVDLEIDPRVFRKPDAAELRHKILSTATKAVREVTERGRELVEQQIPPEVAEIKRQYVPDWDDSFPDLMRPDSELFDERGDR